jgi:hypothetical protein
VSAHVTSLRPASVAAAAKLSPRTIQSTLFGTFLLLSLSTQQELLEALDHA